MRGGHCSFWDAAAELLQTASGDRGFLYPGGKRGFSPEIRLVHRRRRRSHSLWRGTADPLLYLSAGTGAIRNSGGGLFHADRGRGCDSPGLRRDAG